MAIDCLKCKNNRICSIYKDYKDIIRIESCELNIDKLDTSNNILPGYHIKNASNDDASRIINRSIFIEALNKDKVTDTVKTNPGSITKCEECGEEFNTFETTKCEKCGKIICWNCANEDVSTHKILCNTCYDETEDS